MVALFLIQKEKGRILTDNFINHLFGMKTSGKSTMNASTRCALISQSIITRRSIFARHLTCNRVKLNCKFYERFKFQFSIFQLQPIKLDGHTPKLPNSILKACKTYVVKYKLQTFSSDRAVRIVLICYADNQWSFYSNQQLKIRHHRRSLFERKLYSSTVVFYVRT